MSKNISFGVESASASTTAINSNVNDVNSNIEKLIEKIEAEENWRKVVPMLNKLKELNAECGYEYDEYIQNIEWWLQEEVWGEYQARVDAEFAEVEKIYKYLGLENYWHYLKAEENSHLEENINVLIHLENIKKIAEECIEDLSYALDCNVGYGDGIGVCFPMVDSCVDDDEFDDIIKEYRSKIVEQLQQVAGEGYAELWWEHREEDVDAIYDPLDDMWNEAENIIHCFAEVSDEWANSLLNEFFDSRNAAEIMADKVVEMSNGMYVDWEIGYYEYQFIRDFAEVA